MNLSMTNIGGWPASSMRTYVNTDIYNALPSDLKSKIIETTVVSGRGYNDSSTNFTTTDKVYLLDAKEIHGTSFTSSYHTAKNSERQLDYYLIKKITSSNYSDAIKKDLNGTESFWWLRTAYWSSNNYNFFGINVGGNWSYSNASSSTGVSPAFRIAE
jgi:hypothetical protein